MASVSLLFVCFSYFEIWALSYTEVFGSLSGGICVWLVVRENVWNWAVGLANVTLFFILFYQARLYADMCLQAVYFGLGVYGWWNWLYGDKERPQLPISKTTRTEWIVIILAIPLATWGTREVLVAVQGAAPFWDSLTTVLSLCAQYLLSRKRLENWYFWIAADIIYIPLFFSRGLPLISFLYGIFLLMCLIGIRRWIRTIVCSPSG